MRVYQSDITETCAGTLYVSVIQIRHNGPVVSLISFLYLAVEATH
jgi:hypothetical protein